MAGFKQKAAIAAFVAGGVVVLIWWGCARLEEQVAVSRAAIEQEFYQLPVFSASAEQARIMQEFHFTETQLKGKPSRPEELKRRIEDATENAVKAKFPEGSYVAALKRRQQEVMMAQPGNYVEFTYRNHKTNTTCKVSGVFQMKEKSSNGSVIFVNGKSYFVKYIDSHQRHLFDEALAERAKTELLNTFKTEFDQHKEKYAEQIGKELEQQIYLQAGYVRYGDSWVVPGEVVTTELERRRKVMETAGSQQMAGLAQRHKVWGFSLFNIKRENW